MVNPRLTRSSIRLRVKWPATTNFKASIMPRFWICTLLLAAFSLHGRADTEFEVRIRPLLAEHCHRCHGPKKQQGGLRLDTRDGAMKGGDNGPVIVPGKPSESRLLAVLQPDAEPRMPPTAPLKSEAVKAIEAWIARGAPWPADRSTQSAATATPWGLKPLLPVKVPGDGRANVIDAFINDSLARAGLKSAPQADRRTLLRRASYAITGLPPAAEAVDAFMADNKAGAWDRAVSRLFEGRSHGERWARHWLDVARYADTKGYVFFQDGAFPWSWAYRDWVVSAFQSDMPYDRFVRAQLAADRLQGKECSPADLPALGFLTLGGRFMNNQHDVIDDRIDVVTRGLLGLTVACARCHDHKFDPIPTKDYYSLYSVFAASVEPEVPPLFAPAPATADYAAFQKELQTRELALSDYVSQRHGKMLDSARGRLAEHLLAVARLRGKPPQDEFMLVADPDDLNPTLLKRWRAWLDAPARRDDPAWRLWTRIETVGPGRFAADLAALLAGPDGLAAPEPLRRAMRSRQTPSIAEAASAYASAFAAPERVREPVLVRSWADDASPWNMPLSFFSDLELFPDRAGQDVLKKLRTQVEQWRVSGKGAPPRAHSLVDTPLPQTGRVFLRGNPVRPGELVPRVVPASIGRQAKVPNGSGRLELAQSVTHADHPLLARVWVNRVWMNCFGDGLSRTPGDFGIRGDIPSHPELLDYLAKDLIDHGWSTRRLLRLILASDTWQRSSNAPEESRIKDPENRLLSRRDTARVDFEALRDSMLAVSGRLDATSGGASSADLNSTRRTLYLHIDRLQVPGLFRQFDFPSPDATAAKRDVTTTPLQALWLMNHPFGLACADALVRRAGDSGKREVWVKSIYRMALQRDPEPDETMLMIRFLEQAGADAPRQAAQVILAGNEFSFIN